MNQELEDEQIWASITSITTTAAVEAKETASGRYQFLFMYFFSLSSQTHSMTER